MNTSVTLDVAVQGSQAVVAATKGNFGNTYTFSFTNGSQAVSLADITLINLYVKKPDGVSLYNNCTISSNTAIYTETEQTTLVAGNAECMIQIIKDGTVLWSPMFTLRIAENLASSSSTLSEFEMNALAKYPGAKGDKGDTGDSGVYVGSTEPTNGANVWINPDGEAEVSIPHYTASDAGKVLKVNSAGTGLEWLSIPIYDGTVVTS